MPGDLLTECREARDWPWAIVSADVVAADLGTCRVFVRAGRVGLWPARRAEIYTNPQDDNVDGPWMSRTDAALDALPGALREAARRLEQAAGEIEGGSDG